MKEILNILSKEDFFDLANFHIHSNYSDGKVSFLELIEEANSIGLKHYSITDHNTLIGYKNLTKPIPNLIVGVEFDCYFDFNLPHILGYGVDIKNEKLLKLTSEFKKGPFELLNRIFNSRNPKVVIDAIHDAGGIAVLAHPRCNWCFDLDKFVSKLKKFGLDGIEAYYPYDRITRCIKFHTDDMVFEIAKKYSLLITGGTDCHFHLKKDKD